MVIFTSLPKTGSSQTSTTTNAWSTIVQAFDTLQSADSHGAGHESVVTLSTQLNTALAYYNNATTFAAQNNTQAADHYSVLSLNVSRNVVFEAAALDETALNQQLVRQELAYGTAFVMAVISATLTVEVDRLRRLFRKRKTVIIETRSS